MSQSEKMAEMCIVVEKWVVVQPVEGQWPCVSLVRRYGLRNLLVQVSQIRPVFNSCLMESLAGWRCRSQLVKWVVANDESR